MHITLYMPCDLVPWLAPTVTSTITLLAQVLAAVPGQDIVRYVAGEGGRGEGGEGPGTTDAIRQGGRP